MKPPDTTLRPQLRDPSEVPSPFAAAFATAPHAIAFYEALARARQDPSSVEPGSEMAKLASRMGPGSRIAGLTFGPKGADLTPEEIAGQINRSIDEAESGELPIYSTFAEAQAAAERRK